MEISLCSNHSICNQKFASQTKNYPKTTNNKSILLNTSVLIDMPDQKKTYITWFVRMK